MELNGLDVFYATVATFSGRTEEIHEHFNEHNRTVDRDSKPAATEYGMELPAI